MELNESDYAFDFGFTAVDEDELTTVSNAVTNAADAKTKLNDMRKMIQPLLENLKKNPDKDYIFWPKRTAIIDDFAAKLDALMNDA